MSTPGNEAVNQCRNVWHRNPGALLQCPHCKMTKREWDEKRRDTIEMQQRNNPAGGAPEGAPLMRIVLKYFENTDAQKAIDEANDYCSKVSNDRRVRVVDAGYGVRKVPGNVHGEDGQLVAGLVDVFYVVLVTNMLV